MKIARQARAKKKENRRVENECIKIAQQAREEKENLRIENEYMEIARQAREDRNEDQEKKKK